MTLEDWLRRLESLHYKAIDMGLERVGQVAQRLGLLHKLPFIFTIAGTNGKGSTVAFIEAFLLNAGYSVGTYTSPHLITFNERVRINGATVDDLSLVQAFERVHIARGDISLTYFEFTTLAAMLLFQGQRLDALILEVGLGGRLDAVNIWDADVAVITSIDLDHQQFLGDTREQIGGEKIGIARAGKPLVMGEPDPPQQVIDAVAALGANMVAINRDFSAVQIAQQWQFCGVTHADQSFSTGLMPVPLLYWGNAAIALQALLLSPFNVEPKAIEAGLTSASLAGRQQLIQREPDVMLDVGHNPHAARHLVRQLIEARYHKVHCVIGMLRDKAIAETVAELLPVVDLWYPVTLSGERGQAADAIEWELRTAGATVGFTAQTPHHACRQLTPLCRADELILVFGSFYTVADVIQYGGCKTG